MRKLVATVIGTRPEAIKMAPVQLALGRCSEIDTCLIATGQHGALLDAALAAFGLTPDICLDQSPVGVPAIEHALASRLARLRPDLLLVQGDTYSALAAALAAHGLGIAIGHVEAGLRSHDLRHPWPEEGNRIAIDQLATLLFAPSATAMANLAADDRVRGRCHLVGNTAIDALTHLNALPSGLAARTPKAPPHDVLATLHRREAIGAPLVGICAALKRLAMRQDVRITLPLHPNPKVRAILLGELGDTPSISLCAPLGYIEMIDHIAKAHLILSDSGGLQEEAPALGTPLLILREKTERPEAVACGSARLAGTDPRAILGLAEAILDDLSLWQKMAVPRYPYGRGDAAQKIVAILQDDLCTKNVT